MLPISSDDDTEDVTEEGEEIQEKDRSDPHIAEKDAIKVSEWLEKICFNNIGAHCATAPCKPLHGAKD